MPMSVRIALAVVLVTGLFANATEQGSSSPVTVRNGGQEIRLYDDSRALLIGLSEYEDKVSWSRLAFIKGELEQVRQALVNHGFQVTLLSDLKGHQLKSSVRDFLLKGNARKTRLIVFIAGHGWSDNRQLTGHIVPVDAPGESGPGFRSMLLNMEDIKVWSKASNVNHILFLFDSNEFRL